MPLKIAAPPFLVQLFFKTKKGNGFSENYWIQAENYDAALAIATDDFPNLVGVRRPLFTASHYIAYVRVSDSTQKRDTLIKYYTSTTGAGSYVPLVADTLPDSDGLLLRYEGTLNAKPTFKLNPLRLIPEECSTDGVYAPTVAFTGDLTGYFDFLKTSARMVMQLPPNVLSITIENVLATKMTRRKVGRPFDLSLGRSKAP